MYRITINELRTTTEVERSYELLAETGNPHDGGKVFGYVPVEKTRTKEITLFEQLVEDLDVAAVVCVVNKLPPPRYPVSSPIVELLLAREDT